MQKYVSDKIVGTSADSKPTNVLDGATFYETDTKRSFLKVGGSWEETEPKEHGNEAHDPDFVEGPASAVDNRVAVFDGTTGKLIKDGGSLLSEYPKKASNETITGSWILRNGRQAIQKTFYFVDFGSPLIDEDGGTKTYDYELASHSEGFVIDIEVMGIFDNVASRKVSIKWAVVGWLANNSLSGTTEISELYEIGDASYKGNITLGVTAVGSNNQIRITLTNNHGTMNLRNASVYTNIRPLKDALVIAA